MNPQPNGRIDGNDLILTRTFRAPIEDVWTSVTKSECTERWFGLWEGKPGEGNDIRVKMVFEKGDAWMNVTIEKCDAPRHLALKSHGQYASAYELKLSQTGDTTTLTFVQHLKDHKMVGAMGPGWEYYFDNLVAYRAGEPLPKFDDYYPSQEKYYADQVPQAAAPTA